MDSHDTWAHIHWHKQSTLSDLSKAPERTLTELFLAMSQIYHAWVCSLLVASRGRFLAEAVGSVTSAFLVTTSVLWLSAAMSSNRSKLIWGASNHVNDPRQTQAHI